MGRHVDALLTHLGRLDLQSPGIPDLPESARGTALSPVYDALAMLKMDMDQYLAEHRDLVATLRERQKELLRQTAAIETRNRELHRMLQQSSDGQNTSGTVVRQNIQTLLKPLLRLIAVEMQRPHHRGWIHGLSAHIDALADDLLAPDSLERYQLTPREFRVACMVREGASTRAIADHLGLSVRTVDIYRGAIRKKLGLQGQQKNLRTALLTIPAE
jgi:DNA-binding CsgD family transcriptional regulator